MKSFITGLLTILAILALAACSRSQGEQTPDPAAAGLENRTETNPAITAGSITIEMADSEKTLPMISVNGQLYRLLSEQEEPMGDAGAVSGSIASAVLPEETPSEHEQSNFGNVGNPYCLVEESGELVAMIDEKWLRFTAIDLIPQPVHLDRLTSDLNLLGADGVELSYADSDTLVFYSYAGLFICGNENGSWSIRQSLDLAPLGASSTQGDQYSLISADREAALISPRCYDAGPEIPVTYRYSYAGNRLELAGRFQEYTSSGISWSYSADALTIQQKLMNKPELAGLWISNLYPIAETNSNVYGFVAAGADGVDSLQYGLYQSDVDQLIMESVSRIE